MEVNSVSSSLDKVVEGIKNVGEWLGRTFKKLGDAIVDGCVTLAGAIAKIAQTVWDKLEPVLGKVWNWLRSPAAAMTGLATLGAVLVWKSNEQEESATKLAMQGLGLGAAFAAGIVLKSTGLV